MNPSQREASPKEVKDVGNFVLFYWKKASKRLGLTDYSSYI